MNIIKYSTAFLLIISLLTSCKAGTDSSSKQKAVSVLKKEKLSAKTKSLLGDFEKLFKSQQEEREIDEEEQAAMEQARLVRLAVNQTLEELLSLDPDKDQKRIGELAEDLQSMGEEARKAIETMLSDGQSLREQRLLVMAMGAFGNKDANQVLYDQALNSDNRTVREAAMKELKLSSDKEALLAPTIQNVRRLEASEPTGETREKQMTAIAMLGVVGGDRAVDELVYMLRRSEDEQVLKKTVEALGDIGGDSVVDILFGILRDDELLRVDAARALGRLHREDVISGLGEIFLDVNGDQNVRLAAVEGLGEDNGPLARALLLNILKDTRQSQEIHKKAVEKLQVGLGSESKEEAVLYVNLFANTPQDYLPQMLQPLVARGGDNSAKLISSMYQRFNNLKKIHAVRILGRILTDKSFDILLNLMQLEKEADLRREVITALGRFQSDKQKEAMVDLFSTITTTTDDKQERILALKSLGAVAPDEAAEIAEGNLFSNKDSDMILASIDVLRQYGGQGNKGVLFTLLIQGETSPYFGRAEDAIKAIDAREAQQ